MVSSGIADEEIIGCKERNSLFSVIIDVGAGLDAEFHAPLERLPPLLFIKEDNPDLIIPDPPDELRFIDVRGYQEIFRIVCYIIPHPPSPISFICPYPRTGIDKHPVLRLKQPYILPRNVSRSAFKPGCDDADVHTNWSLVIGN